MWYNLFFLHTAVYVFLGGFLTWYHNRVHPPSATHDSETLHHKTVNKLSISLVPMLCFNHFFITLPFFMMSSRYLDFNAAMRSKNVFQDGRDVVILYFMEHVLFYVIHRWFLHHPLIFKSIHYLHHQYVAPVPFSVFYAHPLEHGVQNLFPIFFSLALVQPSWWIIYGWIIASTCNGLLAHSTYFPGYTQLRFQPHLKHHLLFRCNYGINTLMDRWCGTWKK